jgi:hypothetical protein
MTVELALSAAVLVLVALLAILVAQGRTGGSRGSRSTELDARPRGSLTVMMLIRLAKATPSSLTSQTSPAST